MGVCDTCKNKLSWGKCYNCIHKAEKQDNYEPTSPFTRPPHFPHPFPGEKKEKYTVINYGRDFPQRINKISR